jgi:hypothetical protein
LTPLIKAIHNHLKMKKSILLISSVVLVICSSSIYLSRLADPSGSEFQLERKESGRNGMDKARSFKDAAQWRYDRLKDENGHVFSSYFTNAVKAADRMKQMGIRSGLGLQWEELGPDNVGGRTRAILVDRRDTTNNTVYAGGVGGGMWKSTDGAQSWQPLASWDSWLAVSCITQGPDNTIYIGTGEGNAQIGGSSMNSGTMGDGIFKLDANDNRIHITPEVDSTNDVYLGSSPFAAVNRIAVNPLNAQNILAGTQGGIYQTSNGGATWSQVVFTGAMRILTNDDVTDLKWSASGTYIYAAFNQFGGGALVRSANNGLAWTRVSGSGFPTGNLGRIEIAIAPSDDQDVYIQVATASGCTAGAYKSLDGGQTWSVMATLGPLYDPMSAGECQGWYDNVIAVNPFNPNKVYMGGVDFYTWSDSTGMVLADAGLGASAVNPNYIHPDKHEIAFSPNNPDIMYVGCDGGIYKSTNAASGFPFPNFVVSNLGYNVTQNYGIAAAITGEVFGGSQDNGSNYVNYRGNTRMAGQEIIGGDGFFSAISHIDPAFFFGEIYWADLLRSGAYGAGFAEFYDLKVDPQSMGFISACGASTAGGNAPFCTPFLLSETKTAANGYKKTPFVATADYPAGAVINAVSQLGNYPFQVVLSGALQNGDTILVDDPVRSRMILMSFCGVWITSDALNVSITPRWFRLNAGITGDAESFATSPDADVLYVGTTAGFVYRFPNFNAHCDTSTYLPSTTVTNLYTNSSQYTVSEPAQGSIEGVAVDPNNSEHVVATVAGFSATFQPRVYESFNGGVTWRPDTAGLPNMPVYSCVIHDSTTIIVGSELGIWSWDGSQWHEENTGFYRMPVYRMIETPLYTDDCPVIYIGSHGRGMWRTTTLTPSNCQTVTGIKNVENVQVSGLNIYPNPVHSVSHVALMLDKSVEVTLRVFDMTGKLYQEIAEKNTVPGQNLFDLNATGLSSGTYLLVATAANTKTQSRLFTVVK